MVMMLGVALLAVTSTPFAPTARAQAQTQPQVQATPSETLAGFKVVKEDGRNLVEVSLKEVLLLTQQRNTALDSIRLNQTIAEHGLEAAKNTNGATLTNSITYGRAVSPSSGTNFVDAYASDSMTLSSSLGKKTDIGIRYGLTYTEVRSQSQSITIAQEGDAAVTGAEGDLEHASSLRGSLTVPLAQDFGTAANTLPMARGEIGLSKSMLLIRQREEQMLTLAASTYWDMVGAQEQVRVGKEAMRLSEQLLKNNLQRLQAGVLSPTDIQFTRTQLSRDKQRLLSAQIAVLRIEDQVRAFLNLENLQDYGMKPTSKPTQRNDQPEFETEIVKVYRNHAELAQLETDLMANSLDMVEAENKTRSDLDLELYYTFNGYASNQFKGSQGFSDTLTNSYGATLTWTVPLFDTSAEEKLRQRALERQQLELRLQSLKSDLSVKLQTVIRQIRLSREEADTSNAFRLLAEELLKNEIERFRLGQSTSFQVSQLKQDAAEAQVQEILTRIRSEINYLDLMVITGELYDHYGLTPTAERTGE